MRCAVAGFSRPRCGRCMAAALPGGPGRFCRAFRRRRRSGSGALPGANEYHGDAHRLRRHAFPAPGGARCRHPYGGPQTARYPGAVGQPGAGSGRGPRPLSSGGIRPGPGGATAQGRYAPGLDGFCRPNLPAARSRNRQRPGSRLGRNAPGPTDLPGELFSRYHTHRRARCAGVEQRLAQRRYEFVVGPGHFHGLRGPGGARLAAPPGHARRGSGGRGGHFRVDSRHPRRHGRPRRHDHGAVGAIGQRRGFSGPIPRPGRLARGIRRRRPGQRRAPGVRRGGQGGDGNRLSAGGLYGAGSALARPGRPARFCRPGARLRGAHRIYPQYHRSRVGPWGWNSCTRYWRGSPARRAWPKYRTWPGRWGARRLSRRCAGPRSRANSPV